MNKLAKILPACIVIILVALFSEQQSNNTDNTKRYSSEYINCFIKCPIGTNIKNMTIDHGIFTISYNPETKFSDWVAYKVIKKNLDGETRKRNWKKDPMIPIEHSLQPKDFRGLNAAPLNFDRGHQAPLASFSNTSNWHKTNYVSNITPQKSDLNRGIWVKLESKIRKLARMQQDVFVLTGPYYSNEYNLQLPNTAKQHKIPAGYWKIIITDTTSSVKISAFMIPQGVSRMNNYCEYLVEITDISRKTNLQFFDNESIEYKSLNHEIGC